MYVYISIIWSCAYIPVVYYKHMFVFICISYIMRVGFFSRAEKLLSPSSRPRLRLVVCHPDKAVCIYLALAYVYIPYYDMCTVVGGVWPCIIFCVLNLQRTYIYLEARDAYNI